MKRRLFLSQTGAAGAGFALMRAAGAAGAKQTYLPSAVISWNSAATSAIAAARFAPTTAARTLAMVFEAVYNAWACYDSAAAFTLSGLRKRSTAERRTSNKSIAVSYAAYGVLVDLFPAQQSRFALALATATAGLVLTSQDAIAAVQVGQFAAGALLQARHFDGSNQLGDMTPSGVPYADTSGYLPANSFDTVVDPTRWQPLMVTSAAGLSSVQSFVTPHWGAVRPFALKSGSMLRPAYTPGPSFAEMDQVIAFSAGLTDANKVLVDFFANNPGSVTPPGQWMKIAETVSAADGNSLDADVRLFFTLAQAMLDASIACWDAKRVYDSVRPITAIRHHYSNQTIQAWGGPELGTVWMRGADWKPYQRTTNPSPAFPEFLSGHSTFSGAAAVVLAALRGDRFDLRFTFPAGGVPFDPSVPAAPVTLSWTSFTEAAAAAGLSRRYGGIHFEQGDLQGRVMGRQVGQLVQARANRLFQAGENQS